MATARVRSPLPQPRAFLLPRETPPFDPQTRHGGVRGGPGVEERSLEFSDKEPLILYPPDRA